MEQRYLRKYKLTIGSPLVFYEGEVSSQLLTTPKDRLAQRALRNAQLEAAFNTSPIRSALLGATGTVVGENPDNSLLDPERRAYERFIQDQEQLVQEVSTDTANGAVIETLHITFDLSKGTDDKNNKIVLYNISNDTRNLLIQRGSKFNPIVKLEAGYDNDTELALVFLGEVVQTVDAWEGATRVTTLTVKAAPTAQKEAYTIRSYKKDTTVETIVRDVISDMRLSVGVLYIPEANGTEIKIDKNEYIQCQSWEGLVSLCGKKDLKATIEDGKVNVTPKALVKSDTTNNKVDEFLNGTSDVDKFIGGVFNTIGSLEGSVGRGFNRFLDNQARNRIARQQVDLVTTDGLVAIPEVKRLGVQFDRTVAKLFSANNGSIIGSPLAETTNSGGMERQQGKPDSIKVKVFLDATIKLEDLVQIQANLIDGIYRVVSIRHTGEYEGKSWYTELTLEAMSSWVVDTGVQEDNIKALKALQEQYTKK